MLRRNLKTPGSLLLIACIWVLACRSEQNPAGEMAGSALSEADSIQLRVAVDSLQEVAESDSTRTYAALLEVADKLKTLQDKKAWVAALTELYKYHRAHDQFDQICQIYEHATQEIWWPEDGLAGKIHVSLGYALRQTARNYAACRHYEKARELSDRYGKVTTQNPAGPIYKTLANIKTRLGENEEAEKLFRTALDLLQADTVAENKIANTLTQAEIHSDMGIAFNNAGDPVRALEQCETGLALFQNLRNLSPKDATKAANTQGLLLSSKAGALAMQGRFAEGEASVQRALMTLSPNKFNYRFSALNILADIQDQTGKHAQATEARLQALQLAQEPESEIESREVAKVYNTMGWAAYQQKKYPEAAKNAQTALRLVYPKLSDDLSQNPDPAIFSPDPENAVAEALDLKGEALWQQYQEANSNLESQTSKLFLNLADSATSLAILMMENLRNAAVYESSKLGSAQQSRALFGRMLRILYARHQAGDASAAALAFEFAEKNKAVLLHQKVAADAALRAAGVADTLIQQERDLKEQWAYYRNQLFQRQMLQNSSKDTVAQNLNKRIYQIEEKQRSLHKRIADRYHLAPDERAAKTATAAEVQRRLLRTGETWVSYFTDRDSGLVYLITVDKSSIRLARQPFRDESVLAFLQLFNTAQQAENRSGDPALWADFVRQGRRLFETLVQAALPDGEIPERLALSPDGALALLPFDVLLSQTIAPDAPVDYTSLPYLALRCQTRLSPSASLELFHATRRRPAPRGRYVGFAPDYTGSVLGQVVSGADVVRQAAGAFSGKAYLAEQARLDTFLQQAGGYAILHFHGHAEASDSFPDYSWMAFTAGEMQQSGNRSISSLIQPNAGARTLGRRPGRMPVSELDNCLFAHQIYHSHLGADLVLLSACQTGLGKIALGEGTLSLSRAFQAAGCPATVMSLWEVRDDATAELMRLFLENIRLGQDKDEALARAKRTYLQNTPDAFPYYWAGFVLTGNADPVRLSDASWWLYGALLLCLAGVAVAAVRRFLRKSS